MLPAPIYALGRLSAMYCEDVLVYTGRAFRKKRAITELARSPSAAYRVDGTSVVDQGRR